MRLGANIGYFSALAGVEDELRFAVEAERLGYDSLWVGEPYGNDAATVLAWFAGATSTITLGSGILAIPGRTPAMCGQTAATLDLISSGRLILGLGASGPQVSEGWHGVRFARQLRRTREYVDIVRMVVRRDRVRYEGQEFVLPLPDGPGKALKLILHPPRPEIPVYLAALGPRNLELCGEIADGWLPLWYAPEHAERLAEPLVVGAERAGRDPAQIAVCPSVMFRVDDDLDRARAIMRPALALYVGGMGSRKQNFYRALIGSYGYEELSLAVQDRYLGGDQAGAAAMLPDELIDLVCLCGPIDRVAARLADFARAGVDTVIGIPGAMSADERLDQLRRLAEAGAAAGVAMAAGVGS